MIFDIVTVYHNEDNQRLADKLEFSLKHFHYGSFNLIKHSNMEQNLGFAKGCNVGASKGSAPYLGFLNPDVDVYGPIIDILMEAFDAGADITGDDFGKPDAEKKIWGCSQWICGAAFFIRRSVWEELGGFDEAFVWGWEETDLIRRAQLKNFVVKAVELPIRHESPTYNSDEDHEYKNRHFNNGAAIFTKKWGRNVR